MNTIRSEDLFLKGKSRMMIDWNLLYDSLYREILVSKEDAKRIIIQASNYFSAEPNLLYLQDPVVLVGDIHGQFFDTREIFRLGGSPTQTKYLFLGDYVDRGAYGTEVILALFALKINNPNGVFLLRGNHECRQMTIHHDFREEMIRKYDQEVYEMLMDSFDRMPIACVINGQFAVMHGGISPAIENILDVNNLIDRFHEPPAFGALCDLLWSDPIDNETGEQDGVWKPNLSRNCSYYFGFQAIMNFLKKNELVTLIRAHEAQFEGFKAYSWQRNDFPQVVTLFSAPNYCGTYANKGAIMKISVGLSEQRSSGSSVQFHPETRNDSSAGRRLHSDRPSCIQTT